ncbi:DNA (cytosine-5)-methyltransferase 1 [Geopseudomonas sagittaria]|uniref:DNA (cytosine-5-)-methyltransferase n=1 Tax=Geopseudomonas sagittaria TaxID=1135990 RepID=A0A1I5YRR6_9GAMM|nr:DNA cytosine methyltransferase [Pseudomonas sagittaria]SFQ46790.1 DNA (cytosine-5)-methyltransferase 1 [Pseudomonas sagittaria]
MRYGSVCSGIEAASVAWHPLGWRADWFAEIEKFPAAVLAHHYPIVPNLGDMTRIARQVLAGTVEAPDVLVGGTPCQAFSVAGMRAGLDDPRGALTIKFVELADAIDHVRVARGDDPAVIVWENVPGVLSDRGNAFGCFLGALAGEDCELQPSGGRWTDAGCVYGPKRAIAWRVLDAQYFGLAQRRRRVFVVASARNGFDPAAVLFEREGVRRDTPPRRGEGQDVAGTAPFGPALQCGCGYLYPDTLGAYGCPACEGEDGPGVEVLAGVPLFGGGNQGESLFHGTCLTAHGIRHDFESEVFAVHGTQDPCVQSGMAFAPGRNSGQENAVLSVALRGREGGGMAELGDEVAGCLRASSGGGDKPHVLAPVCVTGHITHTLKAEGFDGSEDGTGRGQPIVCATPDASYGRLQGCSGQDAGHGHSHLIPNQSAVRRLTPVETERLQGFPDNYTRIPWRSKPAAECPDGPRYKAIGNSMAVPCMRWIGLRIERHLEQHA